MATSDRLRMTTQREAVLETVRESDGHPSADDVYERVRQRLPHVSLGTVYRNLAVLSQAGLIRQLELAGAPARFDRRTDRHYHVRCSRCGRLEDVQVEPLGDLEAIARCATAYEVTGHRLEFVGLCPDCHAGGPEE